MKSNNNFKVLFVYPNIQMRNIAPPGIAQLAGVLVDWKAAGAGSGSSRFSRKKVTPKLLP